MYRSELIQDVIQINPDLSDQSRSIQIYRINPDISDRSRSIQINPDQSRSIQIYRINPDQSDQSRSIQINPDQSRSIKINPDISRSIQTEVILFKIKSQYWSEIKFKVEISLAGVVGDSVQNVASRSRFSKNHFLSIFFKLLISGPLQHKKIWKLLTIKEIFRIYKLLTKKKFIQEKYSKEKLFSWKSVHPAWHPYSSWSGPPWRPLPRALSTL